MVYCGRPSRGCQNCKTRRIKCDETRPHCLNCEKTNRECPGFPEEVDLIFRNETPGVARKARKLSASGKGTGASSSRVDVDEGHGYDEPRAPNTRKRRRRETQTSVQESDLSPSSSRGSKRPKSLSQFQFQFQLNPTIEQEATTFFFQTFVLSPKCFDSTRGYLEVAASMYEQAKDGSALRLATEAVAISAMTNERKGREDLTQLAAKHYGKALVATQVAIQDSKEATSDATLLSILLCALYESITYSDNSMPAWTKHIDGAVAIVKERGVTQFESPRSLSLFRAVRAQMLANSFQQHKAIDDFPGPNGWLSDLPDHQSDTSESLESSIAPFTFVSNGKELFDREKTAESKEEVNRLLEQASKTQQALQDWELDMPQKWAHRATAYAPHTSKGNSIENAEAWPGPIHIYEDVNVSSLRNNNRVNRMLCSSFIMDALKWLDATGYTNDPRYHTAKYRVQTLVDDVCHSVPFHLLDHMRRDGETKDYNKTMTEAIGGYLLIWPLYTASNMQCIPDIQRRWLQGQLRAIARHYGSEQKSILNPLDNNRIDVADLLGKVAVPPSKNTSQGDRRRSQDKSPSPIIEWKHETLNDFYTEPLLLDPALLAITASTTQMLDSIPITSLAPSWTEVVSAS